MPMDLYPGIRITHCAATTLLKNPKQVADEVCCCPAGPPSAGDQAAGAAGGAAEAGPGAGAGSSQECPGCCDQ